MAPKASRSKGLDGSLQNLSLNSPTTLPHRPKPTTPAKPASSKASRAPADSWEDDADAAHSSDEAPNGGVATPVAQSDFPAAPPPTPVSAEHQPHRLRDAPFHEFAPGIEEGDEEEEVPGRGKAKPGARPEKTTATAQRMIAAGLGVKAPRRTEEQRAYDKAARENEVRRREKEREDRRRAEEDRERARRDVWDG